MRYFPVENKKFVILGLARTGLAAVEWLIQRNAQVYVFDQDLERQQQALELGAHLFDGEKIDWHTIAALLQSPGIAPSHPISQAAVAHDVPVITDCNLLRQAYPESTFIGITGTNGKSTTTTLIGHILRQAGLKVAVGGNVGVPALSLPDLGREGYYVLELSSYQLELSAPLSLDVVGWLNISEDHLERHGTMAQYVVTKQRIFATAKKRGQVIIGVDDPWSKAVYQELLTVPFPVIPISCQRHLSLGIYVLNDSLIDHRSGEKEEILSLKNLKTLQGIHNYQNVAVAYAVCISLGLSQDDIIQAIESFPGLVHRQEHVATIQGVHFINDSKATNADAAAKALATYDQIYWIVGGQDKSDGIEPLRPYFHKIRHAFLIGAAMDRFEETLKANVEITRSGDLKTAIGQAYQKAREVLDGSPVVLLSPACASYDQFKDFEHRGDVFREQVKKLEE